MCKFEKTCQPNKQLAPSKEHPYGTEWIDCKKAGGIIHSRYVNCMEKETMSNKIDVDLMVKLYKNNTDVSEIANQLKCSTFYVRETLKKLKIYKPKQTLEKQLEPYKKEIINFYNRYDTTLNDVAIHIKLNYGIKLCPVYVGTILNKWRKEENERN